MPFVPVALPEEHGAGGQAEAAGRPSADLKDVSAKNKARDGKASHNKGGGDDGDDGGDDGTDPGGGGDGTGPGRRLTQVSAGLARWQEPGQDPCWRVACQFRRPRGNSGRYPRRDQWFRCSFRRRRQWLRCRCRRRVARTLKCPAPRSTMPTPGSRSATRAPGQPRRELLRPDRPRLASSLASRPRRGPASLSGPCRKPRCTQIQQLKRDQRVSPVSLQWHPRLRRQMTGLVRSPLRRRRLGSRPRPGSGRRCGRLASSAAHDRYVSLEETDAAAVGRRRPGGRGQARGGVGRAVTHIRGSAGVRGRGRGRTRYRSGVGWPAVRDAAERRARGRAAVAQARRRRLRGRLRRRGGA